MALLNHLLLAVLDIDALLLSSDLCSALFMLQVNVSNDRTEDVREDLDKEPDDVPIATIETSPPSRVEDKKEDLSVPDDLSSAMERIHKMLITQLLEKYSNPDYESLFFSRDNEVSKIAEGQFMCDISASDLCERINRQLSAWNYEIDALTLTRFLAGRSASMTRQFLAVTNVQEDIRD